VKFDTSLAMNLGASVTAENVDVQSTASTIATSLARSLNLDSSKVNIIQIILSATNNRANGVTLLRQRRALSFSFLRGRILQQSSYLFVDSTITLDVSPQEVSSSSNGTLNSAATNKFQAAVSSLTKAVNNGNITQALASTGGSNSIFANAAVDPTLFTAPSTPSSVVSTYNSDDSAVKPSSDTTDSPSGKMSSMVGLAAGIGVGAVVIVAIPGAIALQRYMARSAAESGPSTTSEDLQIV